MRLNQFYNQTEYSILRKILSMQRCEDNIYFTLIGYYKTDTPFSFSCICFPDFTTKLLLICCPIP